MSVTDYYTDAIFCVSLTGVGIVMNESVDQDELQAMDENNKPWVKAWRNAVSGKDNKTKEGSEYDN